jgi:hypothetical protein
MANYMITKETVGAWLARGQVKALALTLSGAAAFVLVTLSVW